MTFPRPPIETPAWYRPATLVAVLVLGLALGCGASRSTRVDRSSEAPRAGSRRDAPGPTEPHAEYELRPLKPARLSGAMCARCAEIRPLIERVAEETGVEAALITAIVRIESGFRPEARSRAGARGLMQVMPRTGRGIGCGDLYDPEANLRCGARVLQRNLERYGGNLVYALAAYNGGAGYVKKAWRTRTLPRNFRYVEKVLRVRSYFLRHSCCDPLAAEAAVALRRQR